MQAALRSPALRSTEGGEVDPVPFELEGNGNSTTISDAEVQAISDAEVKITISDAEVQAALKMPRTSEERGEVDQEAVDAPPLVCGSTLGEESLTAAASSTAAPPSPSSSLPNPNGGKPTQSSWASAGPLLFGIFMGQIGMVLFNLGLTYGFTAIG